MDCKIDAAAAFVPCKTTSEAMILFRETTASYKYLCNDYGSDFIIDGKLYHHIEGYLLSVEYEAKGDSKAAELMRAQQTAVYCRWYYKKSPPPPCNDDVWSNERKLDHMRRAVLIRFVSDKLASAKLLSTNDEALVYNNHSDDYWGCGTAMRGKNMVGVVLMEVRGILRNAPILKILRQ